MSQVKLYWLHALTPLHVGVGRGVDFVDLPIVREKSTGWPMVPGSAVKGVWRDYFFQKPNSASAVLQAAFGKEKEPTSDDEHAGSLVLTDARIVVLPVRSFYGTFAYTTSPLALRRLKRDLEQAGVKKIPPIPSLSNDQAITCKDSQLVQAGKVYLEEMDFAATSAEANEWATCLGQGIFDHDWQSTFQERFLIVSDMAFDFFCAMATEVNARIRLNDETKIVDKEHGALWYEESLPAETVLAGVLWCDRVFGKGQTVTAEGIFHAICDNSFTCQIGGKASVGKGQVSCRFHQEGV